MTRSYNIFNGMLWLVVALIGLTRIPFPFDGDQALFTTGAKQLSQGALLYRDFWDLKQPGIYGFYEIAGRLFGFNEVGIHTFEWFYMMAFAVVLVLALRQYYHHPVAIGVLPLLTVGTYYAACRSWHLTQVEALVAVPLFLCFWFAYGSVEKDGGISQRRSQLLLFLSGVMGGCVLLFKFVLFPLLLVFWLTQVNFKARNLIPTVLLKMIPPILLGLFVCLLPAVIYFNHVGSLGLLMETSFQYPQRILTEVPDSVITEEIGPWWLRLHTGLLWFFPWASPLLVLSGLGFYFSPRSYRDRLTLSCVLWIGVGLLVIWLQQTSLWAYHYSLVFVPCGILAAKGVDIAWEHLVVSGNPGLSTLTKQGILGVALFFLLLPSFMTVTKDGLSLLRTSLGLNEAERFVYQSEINHEYGILRQETAFLSRSDSLPGQIYVFGNPLMYVLSGRTQAIPINGWSLEYLLPDQWQQMAAQFAKALPPYIFVIQSYDDIIAERGASVHQLIQERYRVMRQGQAGTWYTIRG
jgi:hypothetical protein